ncbi:hypothetical protein BT67DRAFT_442124 [Trichocladium antarcticum]|uniref:CCCH zinc finger and RRM domain-containing protein n=1 Tax=Trichocladium antarcticum TaxID=1450529 RepID=A0AAN6UK40_9PEZI|nr:hypothetical protein BT67DRAFT_442124 [Trichocladium antarcticum]
MLFPEEHSQHLKTWIVKRLENTSDADADVLADYVLALLRHDGDVGDVRKLCEDEIPDFLKEDSSVFVSDVFEAIAYRSYLPGGPPPPSKIAALQAAAAAAAAAAPPVASSFYDDVPASFVPPYQQPFQNGSRKRGYNDWDDPNAQNGRDGAGFGGRNPKQPRRGAYGGRGGRSEDPSSYRGSASGLPAFPAAFPAAFPLPGQLPGQGPPAASTAGYFDPSGATMDAMFGMGLAAGHPMPELFSHDRNQAPPRRRARCRDWEKKGYCQRGSNCMFEHSNDPVYPHLSGPPFGSMQSLPQPPAVEEYDPANALMTGLFNGAGPIQGQLPPAHDGGQHPRHKGGRQHNRQRRGDKAAFSADGPVHDRTKSTIVVENIPEESFEEDRVKDFFSQFGSVVEVSMKPYKRLAIVKFDSWNSANAAYHSPKVIFDNRFVKVFWFKEDESAQPGSTPRGGPPKKMHTSNGLPSAGAADSGSQPDLDMEEFAKQQEARQRAYEEKTKRREELERQQQELEKRQKELIAKQREERAKLDAKLQRDGSKSGDGADGGNEDGSSSPKPMNQSEALRAQLAALEAEARQMGLDPDAMADAPAPWPTRGGGYGRGRGRAGAAPNWRGAPYTPRGFRGGARGRANVHAAYAAYSLDNRPKKVVLTGLDFTVSEKDETLRQYLFGIGEFTDIQTTPAATEITFKDRKTAEKFFNSVLLNNKEIPGLDAVELAWAGSNGSAGSVPTTPGTTTSPPTTTTTTTTTTNPRTPAAATSTFGGGPKGSRAPTEAAHRNGNTGSSAAAAAAAAAAAVAGSGDDKDVHIQLERPADQNEMDYEIADEDQWGGY